MSGQRDQMTPLSERILRFLRTYPGRFFRAGEIARRLGQRTPQATQEVRLVLEALLQAGLIKRIKGKRFGYEPERRYLEGILRLTPQGFGFVTPEEGAAEVFISPRHMGTALDGDRVRVALFAHRASGAKHPEGEVVEVLERRRRTLVGTVRRFRRLYVLQPDDRRFPHDVILAERAGAQEGDKVVVDLDLEGWTDPRLNPEGRVVEVLGPAGRSDVEVLAVAKAFEVPSVFPEDALQEAEALSGRIGAADLEGREDFRPWIVFTIDPADAKDFDDAVALRPLPDGTYELGVHVADVSHYVRPGTALDREALRRATSVYLVDRTLPMLPERLSNDLCSLRPEEDRLVYSVILNLTPQGRVLRYRITKGVICSRARFTYEEVDAILEGRLKHPFAEILRRMNELAKRLRARRMRNGSLDFDLPEVKFVLDAHGLPVEVIPKVRKDSHKLIEEFMLLANRTVAEHIGRLRRGWRPRPFIYRVHDEPDPQKLIQLDAFVRHFGYRLQKEADRITARSLQRLLREVEGSPEEGVIEQVVLRSMAKAVYATRNIGHYGLAFRYYTHFTSPIRRYPDLMVHRLLDRYSRGGSDWDAEELEAICRHCSQRERAADEAERESVKLKQVEYMSRRLGQVFEGVISGVTPFGFFVELLDTLAEGLVRVRDLRDDYYVLDERRYALIGQSTGRCYRLGDRVRVVPIRADTETRQLDFQLADY
ncbi:MAG: ribonuclease R [Rhodothermia bacterium]|nr:ribonuclease R [Rhodothermia bacterium]